MRIHGEICPEQVEAMVKNISKAPILLMDGNLRLDTMETVMRICCRHNVPVWFEPTEIRKAKKILQVGPYWDCIRYLSPNLRELVSLGGEETNVDEEEIYRKGLRESLGDGGENGVDVRIYGHLGEKAEDEDGGNNPKRINDTIPSNPLYALISRTFSMFTRLRVILLTGGSQGFYVIQRQGNEKADAETEVTRQNTRREIGFNIQHYTPSEVSKKDILSVSGAGDCLNAGFISGILSNASVQECSLKGRQCAKEALTTTRNVPRAFNLLFEEAGR